MKNRSKKKFKIGRHRGIDFFIDFGGLGRQVGTENPIWSDQIRSGQIRLDQVRSGQIRSDQVRSGARGPQAEWHLGGMKDLPAMKGWVPWTLEPSQRDVAASCTNFFAILVPFFFFIVFPMPSWIDLDSIFHPNFAPKIQLNLRKWMPRCLPILTYFWIDN